MKTKDLADLAQVSFPTARKWVAEKGGGKTRFYQRRMLMLATIKLQEQDHFASWNDFFHEAKVNGLQESDCRAFESIMKVSTQTAHDACYIIATLFECLEIQELTVKKPKHLQDAIQADFWVNEVFFSIRVISSDQAQISFFGKWCLGDIHQIIETIKLLSK